jgi:hypothetical protein
VAEQMNVPMRTGRGWRRFRVRAQLCRRPRTRCASLGDRGDASHRKIRHPGGYVPRPARAMRLILLQMLGPVTRLSFAQRTHLGIYRGELGNKSIQGVCDVQTEKEPNGGLRALCACLGASASTGRGLPGSNLSESD